jgi:putative peptidoglycan lipid II flippase
LVTPPAALRRYLPLVSAQQPEQESTAHAGGSKSPPPGFIASARLVAGLTVVSRFAGLARDAICSRIFGAGPVWSAFALAFLLPNLFRRLFGEGALTASFVPEYARLLKHDPGLAHRFASAMFAGVMLALALATLIGEALLYLLLTRTELGESGGLTIRLAMVMLPYLVLVCGAATLGGMLQTHARFGPTAASPILLNLAIIVGASVWGWRIGAPLERTAMVIALSVLVAGVLQLAWSLWALRGHARWGMDFTGVGPSVRTVTGRMLPVIIGLGALQLNTLLDGLIAGWPVLVGPTIALPFVGVTDYPLDESSNAVLFFAQRLYQFPLGVFGVALATAVFPTLSRHADEPAEFMRTLRRGVRLTLFIGVPASVGLVLVRHDLPTVILRGGNFGEADVARVSTVLVGYAPAIWAYALTHTLARAYYALGDMRTPMRVALAMVAANVALNLVLIWPLREAGLAWSTSICAIFQCAALALLLRRRTGEQAFDRQTLGAVGRCFAGAAAMGLALVALHLLVPPPETWSGSLLRLAATVGLGASVYFAFSKALRMPETKWAMER